VTGYAVGLADHRTAGGDIVWYGGGRLAPDLTLPQLRFRWTGAPPPRGGHAARLAAIGSVPLDVSRRAAKAVREATEAMRAASSPAVASAIAYAAADLLAVTAKAWEGEPGGPLTTAADWFDRADHDLRERAPARRVSQAGQLRTMARLIAVMGALSRDSDTMAALHLIYILAALAESLADLREAQQRWHQAQAARDAARQIRGYRLPAGPPRPSRTAWAARPPEAQPTPANQRSRQR
jgi:hypothetical protein